MLRRVVLRAEWRDRNRVVVVVEVMRCGEPVVTVKVGRDCVNPANREAAADWLKDFLPRLSHDERYAILWE